MLFAACVREVCAPCEFFHTPAPVLCALFACDLCQGVAGQLSAARLRNRLGAIAHMPRMPTCSLCPGYLIIQLCRLRSPRRFSLTRLGTAIAGTANLDLRTRGPATRSTRCSAGCRH
eukprot:SAG11_NODE_2542_length_3237_cov_1.924841_6_plen_117_part_00